MEGLLALILFIAALWFVPPVVLTIVAIVRRRKKPQASKTMFIHGPWYGLLAGAGICASLSKLMIAALNERAAEAW
ncbi:MAG: hypothetical protein HC859_13065 [Bacteroidia bacterium]|nr:hypothetical protein [Bacteroidia bacterium]